MVDEQQPDKRNRLGGPVRNGNRNPGQGKGAHAKSVPGHGSGPRADTQFKTVFGTATEGEATEAGKRVFRGFMTDDKRVRILNAMYEQAGKGNVMAARLLLDRDMGAVTQSTEVTDRTPLKGAVVSRMIDKLIDQRKQELTDAGVDASLIDRALEQDIWRDYEHDEATP